MSNPAYQIRHATPSDCDAVTRLFTGPKAIRGTLQLPYPSPEVWRQRLFQPDPGLITLVACHEAELVGVLGLHTRPDRPRRRHSAELGMTVGDDWQGKGVGTALLAAAIDMADNWLNLERLELSVFIDNEPAVNLYKNFGFETEGTLRRYAFRDGQFVDAFLMARLRPVSPR